MPEGIWRRALVLALAATCLITAGWSAEAPLASRKLIQALTDEVSGETAFQYTDRISKFDRIQASEGWHDAAVMIQEELLRLGYKDVVIEGWPSDGSRRYYTYRSVIGWRAKKGELWMVSPARQRLCSYDEIPLTLVKHSGPAHVEAGLTDVGSGVGDKAYANKDVKGQIVLATGATAEVMREAVLKRGALGVLTYYAADTRPGYPNMIRYTALWPRWEEREKLGFGFNISKNQGATLKRLLEEGQKVVLKAEVETQFFETKLEVLSAALPGSAEPQREVMIIGHLCHPTPSANDNASGSGGMLEMARALKSLIDRGALEPPQRTIRFLWVPEFNGTVPYIRAHLERTRNTLAVINCDMIGEDFHKTSGMLGIFSTPHSLPSYLNDVVANFAALAEGLGLTSLNGSSHPFAWKLSPYSGGSDHVVFNDGALRIPAVMLNRGDTFHHTSLDSMDKVDPTELRRSCFIALGAACYLASTGDEEALDVARLVARNGLGRFAADFYDAVDGLEEAGNPEKLKAAYAQVANVVAHSAQRETDAVLSARALAKDAAILREIAAQNTHLESARLSFSRDARRIYGNACAKLKTGPGPLAPTEAERRLARLVPVRSEDFICPLSMDYLAEKLGPGVFDELKLRGDLTYEALNYVDGKRSLLDIARAVSAEYGPVDPENVNGFFRVLERAGLVRLKE